MADEEDGPSSYLSFANRYQADLELIYQKYEKTFDDGTVESQEILLSNLEDYDDGENVDWFESLVNDHEDVIDDDASDDGWESDTSGPTDCPSQDELNDINNIPTIDGHLNNAICLKPDKQDSKKPDYPLSSTILGDVDSVFIDKVDPNISPVGHLHTDISRNERFRGKNSGSLSDDLAAFRIPVIKDRSEFKSKHVTHPKDALLSTEKKSKGDDDARITRRNSKIISIANNNNNSLVSQESSVVPTSLAQAILNTRNRIANVLFEAVLSCQSESSSKSSGYDSMSSDSSSALQRMSKESMFLPDKLLKEFNSRLTAEIMSHGNDSFSARGNDTVNRYSSRKPSVTIRPGLSGRGRKKTVSLLASRKTITVNPSLQLTKTSSSINFGVPSSTQINCQQIVSNTSRAQTFRPVDSSRERTRSDSVVLNTSSRRKSISLSGNESKAQQIAPHNAKTPQSLDSKRLRQVVSTKAILKLSPGLPPIGKMEMSVSDASGIKTQSFESTLLPRNLGGHPGTKPSMLNHFVQLPRFPAHSNNRRSIPLTSRCLPAPEITNNKEVINGNLSGNGKTIMSRKRSSMSDLESVSPKRACHRSHEGAWTREGLTSTRVNSKDSCRSSRVSPSLKRNYTETDKCLPNKRHKVSECTGSHEELYYSPVRSKCSSKVTTKRSSVKLDSKRHRMHLDEERHLRDTERSKPSVHKHCMCQKPDDGEPSETTINDYTQNEKVQNREKRRENGTRTNGRKDRSELEEDRTPQSKRVVLEEDDEEEEFKRSKSQYLDDFEQLHRKITQTKKHKQPVARSKRNSDHRVHSPKSTNPCGILPVRDSREHRKDKYQIKEAGCQNVSGCDLRRHTKHFAGDCGKSSMDDGKTRKRDYGMKEKVFGSGPSRATRHSPLQDKDVPKQGKLKLKESHHKEHEFNCDNELKPNRNSGCSHAEHRSRNHYRILESTRKDHSETVTQSGRSHEEHRSRNHDRVLESTRKDHSEPVTQSGRSHEQHRSRNHHRILESTRKDRSETVTPFDRCRITQCKEYTNKKNSNRLRLKKRGVDGRYMKEEIALHCSPGNCKKSLCFECGNFSLEEHSDLSISAISRIAQM